MFFNIKKLSIALFVISSCLCSFSHANEPENIQHLSGKAVLPSGNGFFVLSDQSCWKVVGFCKRWRTVSEWWNDEQLIPKCYETTPDDWNLDAPIEVYSKYPNLTANEEDASNQKSLQKCSHLFVNQLTGTVLFAQPLSTAACVSQVFNSAFESGYNKGHKAGYQKGRSSSNDDAYKTGFKDGYDKGFKEGCSCVPN